MPVVKDIKQEEEAVLLVSSMVHRLVSGNSNVQSNEAEGFYGMRKRTVGIRKVRGGKNNRNKPKIREDNIEQ
jgi:hypothetical protein